VWTLDQRESIEWRTDRHRHQGRATTSHVQCRAPAIEAVACPTLGERRSVRDDAVIVVAIANHLLLVRAK